MMRSATAFLPDSMITFMNLERSTDPNLGSGRMSRLGTSRRRGMTLFLRLQLARTSMRASGRHRDDPLTRRHRNGAATKSAPGTRPGAGWNSILPRRGPGATENLRLLRALGAVLRTRLL